MKTRCTRTAPALPCTAYILFVAAAGAAAGHQTLPGEWRFAAWLAACILLVIAGLLADRSAGRESELPSPGSVCTFVGSVVASMGVGAASFPCFAIGVAIIAGALGATARPGSKREDLADRAAMAFFTISAALFFSIGIDSWRWAFLGDEYAFYGVAREIASGERRDQFLSSIGVYGLHPLMGSVWQALPLELLGDTNRSWRSGNIAFACAAIPLLYAFSRAVHGRVAAVVACSVYASSHVLFSIAKMGWQNIQVMPFLTLVLYASLRARGGSQLWLSIASLAAGVGWYSFGFARAFVVLIPLWLFGSPRWAARSVFACACAIALTVPLFSDIGALGDQVSQMRIGAALDGQFDPRILFARNVLSAAIIPFSSPRTSIFISGPHLDIFSAALFAFGLLVLLFERNRDGLSIVATYCYLAVMAGAFHQYDYPPNTRMFALVALYAIVCGAGARVFEALARRSWALSAPLWILLLFYSNFQRAVGPGQTRPQHWIARVLAELEHLPSGSIVYARPWTPDSDLTILKEVVAFRGFRGYDIRQLTDERSIAEACKEADVIVIGSGDHEQALEELGRCWTGKPAEALASGVFGPDAFVLRR